MRKAGPKHYLRFRWGNFQLQILGKATILWSAAALFVLLGLKLLASRFMGAF
jgi:hypothetical protein